MNIRIILPSHNTYVVAKFSKFAFPMLLTRLLSLGKHQDHKLRYGFTLLNVSFSIAEILSISSIALYGPCWFLYSIMAEASFHFIYGCCLSSSNVTAFNDIRLRSPLLHCRYFCMV